VIDRGLEEILERQRKLGKGAVTVGLHSQAPGEGGARAQSEVVTIGTVHEFGSSDGSIPERSYLRSTMDERRDAIADLQQKTEAKVAAGNLSPDQGLGILGAFAASAVQAKIVAIREPGLAEETIRRKGHDNPLIASGQLKGAVTYVVHSAKPRAS